MHQIDGLQLFAAQFMLVTIVLHLIAGFPQMQIWDSWQTRKLEPERQANELLRQELEAATNRKEQGDVRTDEEPRDDVTGV